MTRARLRDLGITIGSLPPGVHNAITDVPGVWVGHCTLHYDTPRIARTGVTVIVPREGQICADPAFAGLHVLNGFGEMTGSHWIAESGLLCSPIGLTSSFQVGTVHEAIIRFGVDRDEPNVPGLPVVAETWDGWLSDVRAFHLTAEHVAQALDAARPGPVPEGNVGGGTGLICHDFKGGIGTASRVVELAGGRHTVGALVQANHGDRHLLRVDGVPVGREIGPDHTPFPWDEPPQAGSIVAIVATDAPLLPFQCRQLAQRAAIGTATVGNIGHYSSGDIFLAFATGNHIDPEAAEPAPVIMVPHAQVNPLFEATVEATAEAILNALTTAETMTGYRGRTAYALPLDELQRVMDRYHRGPLQPRKPPAPPLLS